MAITLTETPEVGEMDAILKAAGVEGVVSCPGKASPNCLVPMNVAFEVDASGTNVNALIDPLQTMIPLQLSLSANADLSFRIFSGQGNKTVNAEGTSITDVYTPGDFSTASLFAELNRLPIVGAISKERPMRLQLTNADAINPESSRGTMLGMTTDKDGNVDAGKLAYYLEVLSGGRFKAHGRPQAITLCTRGYRVVGGVAQVPKRWCEGKFPPGYLAPLKLATVTLAAGVPGQVPIGPLQGMVPVTLQITDGAGDTTFTILDPETLKDASPSGGEQGFTGATNSSGSIVTDVYTAADFTFDAFQSNVNRFPWTTLGAMSRERPAILEFTSVIGGTVEIWCWALVLDENQQVPTAVLEFLSESMAAS